jgi:hypothetical protein
VDKRLSKYELQICIAAVCIPTLLAFLYIVQLPATELKHTVSGSECEDLKSEIEVIKIEIGDFKRIMIENSDMHTAVENSIEEDLVSIHVRIGP